MPSGTRGTGDGSAEEEALEFVYSLRRLAAMADCVVADADAAVKMTEDALVYLPDEVRVKS